MSDGGQTAEYAPGVYQEAEPLGGIADTYSTENEERDHEGQTQDICKLSHIRSQAALHCGERVFLEYQLIIANIAVKESCRHTIEFNRRYHSLTMGNYNALN